MKTSFWDRVLMFLYVLIALAFCLGMALRPFGIDLIGGFLAGIERATGRFFYLLIALGLTAIVALLSLYMLTMIFRRERKRVQPFITINSGDGGQVRIALSALSQLARQAVGHVAGVKDMKIGIDGDEDAISVAVDLTLEAGAHVPTVTMNMQRTIRNHIESNCGVAVRDVEITVSSLADAESAQEKSERRRRHKSRAEKAEERAAESFAAPVPEVPAPADDWKPEMSAQPESAAEIPELEDDAPLPEAEATNLEKSLFEPEAAEDETETEKQEPESEN